MIIETETIQKTTLCSILCMVSILLGMALAFALDSEKVTLKTAAEVATLEARAYFNFNSIECELNRYCFFIFPVFNQASDLTHSIEFPFATWSLEVNNEIRLQSLTNYKECTSIETIEITLNDMLEKSFMSKLCPFPRDTLLIESRLFILLQQPKRFKSLFDPLLGDFLQESTLFMIYQVEASEEMLITTNDGKQLTSNFTLSSTLDEEATLAVDLFPYGSIMKELTLASFEVYKPKTKPPTKTPTTLSPTKAPTPIGFQEKHEGSRPNIVVIMLDDLGYGDVGFGEVEGYSKPREKIQEATKFITKLAKEESIRLTRHYGHWQCSPSRRSFLTGRLSIHTGERLSRQSDHDLDLRFKWISEKLKEANYSNYMVGKGHFGYNSVYHLPSVRGFDEFVGILNGQAKYENFQYWNKNLGNQTETTKYSTQFFSDKARDFISQESKDPFFLFMSLQTPHTPIEPPNTSYERYKDFTKKHKHPYEYMLYTADYEINQTVALLKQKGLWENTLLLFLSDNGATQQRLWPNDPYKSWSTKGSNYPFRGEKKSSFEGGFRVPAFISGGIVPKTLRGKTSGLISHVSDWFSTFCFLAGVDPFDDNENSISPLELLQNLTTKVNLSEIDSRYPSLNDTNLWGNNYPSIDSINILQHLIDEESFVEATEFHPKERQESGLMLSTEAMVFKQFKFIAAQGCSFLVNTETCKDDTSMYGWMQDDSATILDPDESLGCLVLNHPLNEVVYKPCVFDLSNDLREEINLQNETLLRQLFDIFNKSLLTQYTDLLAGKKFGLTPTDYINSTDLEIGVQQKLQLEYFGTLESPTQDLSSCFIHNQKLKCQPMPN